MAQPFDAHVVNLIMFADKISRPVKIIAVTGFLTMSILQVSGQSLSSLAGKWRGEFAIRDNIKSPFNFEVTENGSVVLLNGEERFETGKLILKGDSVFLPLDQFDNELALHYKNGLLSGVLRKQDRSGNPVAVVAKKGNLPRFKVKKPPSRDLSGRYQVVFTFDSGKEEEALAVFEQSGQRLTGTFLKKSGDTRFLEGVVEGNRFYLSSFIGSSPGYYEGTVYKNGEMKGFQAGTRIRNEFEGKYDPDAKLPEVFTNYEGAEEDKTISFSLPDINGDTVSLSDEKYKNKVVILAITGTWCPNCVDEAAFLSPWYKKNKDRGVEIITIHFERQADTAFTRKVMTRFRKRFDIQYDQVFGGLSNVDSVKQVLKGLNSFSSFPTTIFVGSDGVVSKIHSGYTGPATGKFYDEFVKEFNAEVDRLLLRRASSKEDSSAQHH